MECEVGIGSCTHLRIKGRILLDYTTILLNFDVVQSTVDAR